MNSHLFKPIMWQLLYLDIKFGGTTKIGGILWSIKSIIEYLNIM